MVSIFIRYKIVYKALFDTEQYLNIDILHTISVGGILSRQYRQFAVYVHFLCIWIRSHTLEQLVIYLPASSGKWYACDGNCSNANWRLCTSLVWITSPAKRRSSGRFHCAPPALPPPPPPAPACACYSSDRSNDWRRIWFRLRFSTAIIFTWVQLQSQSRACQAV